MNGGRFKSEVFVLNNIIINNVFIIVIPVIPLDKAIDLLGICRLRLVDDVFIAVIIALIEEETTITRSRRVSYLKK